MYPQKERRPQRGYGSPNYRQQDRPPAVQQQQQARPAGAAEEAEQKREGAQQ